MKHLPRLPTAIMFPETPLLSTEYPRELLNCSEHCRKAHLSGTGLRLARNLGYGGELYTVNASNMQGLCVWGLSAAERTGAETKIELKNSRTPKRMYSDGLCGIKRLSPAGGYASAGGQV